MAWVLAIHFAVTAMLAGVIWVAQILQYPIMLKVGPENWASFHKSFMWRMSCIMAPLMAIELLLAAYMAIFPLPDEFLSRLAWWELGLTIIAWISTFGLQWPIHARLSQVKDEGLLSLLIITNWARTCAWTLKLLLCVFYVAQK